jgi:hypothetical protein
VKRSFGGAEQPDHQEEEELDWLAGEAARKRRVLLKELTSQLKPKLGSS